jgi:Tol biopolymer transport system component
MTHRLILAALALTLLGAAASRASDRQASATQCDPTKQGCFELESTIAFSSTRDHVNDDPALTPVLLGAEVYLINPDMTNPRRLTNNSSFDGLANLSPDGKKIAFDSTRYTGSLNVSDLFLMNIDGTEQTLLTHGSSAAWSPDSKNIAFHASASGAGTPIRTDPGSATSDSDIFVANVDDLLAGVEQPTNITNSPDMIDDDPDWSPDGEKIVFTSHPVTDDPRFSNQAELYLMNPDGTGLQRLTHNGEEERAPAWSPDGTRIVYSCRVGDGTNPFRICVMNADGSDVQQLTNEGDAVSDLTATWSPDGQQILYHRRGAVTPAYPTPGQQLFVMNADGSDQTQLTFPPGVNNLAHWGELRVKS